MGGLITGHLIRWQCYIVIARRLHSAYGSRVATLLQRLSAPPVKTPLQGLNERKGQVLQQFHGRDVLQIHQGGADLAQPLRHTPPGRRRDILVDQRLVQSASPPFVARRQKPLGICAKGCTTVLRSRNVAVTIPFYQSSNEVQSVV